jgi:hypothetical protein
MGNRLAAPQLPSPTHGVRQAWRRAEVHPVRPLGIILTASRTLWLASAVESVQKRMTVAEYEAAA